MGVRRVKWKIMSILGVGWGGAFFGAFGGLTSNLRSTPLCDPVALLCRARSAKAPLFSV